LVKVRERVRKMWPPVPALMDGAKPSGAVLAILTGWYGGKRGGCKQTPNPNYTQNKRDMSQMIEAVEHVCRLGSTVRTE